MVRASGHARPGGRTARTAVAVHDAVRALVRDAGPDPISVAQVAARAGVNAATVYRRWGSLEALLLEVAVDDLNERSDLRSSGDLRTDLEAYGTSVVRGLEAPGGMPFLSAIMAAASSPQVGVAPTLALVGRRLELVRAMLAVSDPDGSLSPVDVVDGLVGPLYFRALLVGPPGVTDADVVRLADGLVAVAEHRRRTGLRFPDVWPGADPGS
ncbi:MAG: TetR/AcrR family transcriptional regulator [Janthinobacterium lividum]